MAVNQIERDSRSPLQPLGQNLPFQDLAVLLQLCVCWHVNAFCSVQIKLTHRTWTELYLHKPLPSFVFSIIYNATRYLCLSQKSVSTQMEKLMAIDRESLWLYFLQCHFTSHNCKCNFIFHFIAQLLFTLQQKRKCKVHIKL